MILERKEPSQSGLLRATWLFLPFLLILNEINPFLGGFCLGVSMRDAVDDFCAKSIKKRRRTTKGPAR